MAIFPVGFLVTAPLIGIFVNSIGRKNCICGGIMVMILSTVSFGFATYFTNVYAFYSVSMIARFLQGVGTSSSTIPVPSIIS
jgi:MFS family permease